MRHIYTLHYVAGSDHILQKCAVEKEIEYIDRETIRSRYYYLHYLATIIYVVYSIYNINDKKHEGMEKNINLNVGDETGSLTRVD